MNQGSVPSTTNNMEQRLTSIITTINFQESLPCLHHLMSLVKHAEAARDVKRCVAEDVFGVDVGSETEKFQTKIRHFALGGQMKCCRLGSVIWGIVQVQDISESMECSTVELCLSR